MDRFTLQARAGDTFRRVITWTDKQTGDAINLTGAVVEWSLKRGEVEHQYLGAPQATVTDAASGEVKLELSYEETRALRAQSRAWLYEVTIQLPGTPLDDRTTILEGAFLISKELVE